MAHVGDEGRLRGRRRFGFLARDLDLRGHRPSGRFQGLALDRVAQRANQAAGIDLSLDQIILRALLQGFDRHALVVETAEDHQRNVGSRDMRPADGFQALRVRQAEVEKNDVDLIFAQKLLGFLHRADVSHDD